MAKWAIIEINFMYSGSISSFDLQTLKILTLLDKL